MRGGGVQEGDGMGPLTGEYRPGFIHNKRDRIKTHGNNTRSCTHIV